MTSSQRATVLQGIACLLLVAAPASAVAQESSKASDEGTSETEKYWNGSLSVGATANVVSNENVVGQTNGLSAVLGVSAKGAADWTRGDNEFNGTFQLNETFNRTPTLAEFIHSDDKLKLSAVYNRYLVSWSGLYGNAAAETAIFQNYNVTAEPTDYRLLNADGTESTRSGVSRLRLSEILRPTSLDQSIGAFAMPVNKTPVKVESRLGIAARETFVNGVYVLDDDSATPATEVRELSNVYQAGLEAFVGVSGEFPAQDFSYDAGITGLLPVLNNDQQDRSILELARITATGSLTFDAFDWLSANYEVAVTRDPQLVEQVQVQNSVLLNFQYDLIERRTEDEGPTTEEKLQEAQKRIENLEKRIDEMETEESETGEAGSESSADDNESDTSPSP